jgi:phospholipase C
MPTRAIQSAARPLLAGLFAVAIAVGTTGPAVTAHSADSRSDLKAFQHVWILMMENTSYDTLIGNPNAPWINYAATHYGLAAKYYGVTHPSQPNYIGATSGSTNGVTGDDDVTIDVPNVVDQLEAHAKTWKAYMQSISLCGGDVLAHECGNQLYERKHNPFVSYLDVQQNPARLANIVDLSDLDADLDSGKAPDYSWISPDQCNDMHGRSGPPEDVCSFSHHDELIAAGDAFLSTWVGKITSSKAWTGNSLIVVTWDESDFPFGDVSGCCDAIPGGGHVLTLTISHSYQGARTSDTPYNHYSMLETIEGAWRLGCLAFTCDTVNVPTMGDLVGPKR